MFGALSLAVDEVLHGTTGDAVDEDGQAAALAHSLGWTQRDLPVLVTHGRRDRGFPLSTVEKQHALFAQWATASEFKSYNKDGSMAQSADEMKDIFGFIVRISWLGLGFRDRLPRNVPSVPVKGTLFSLVFPRSVWR